MKKELALIAVALLSALAMGTLAYAEVHRSTGQVVRVDPKGMLVLVENGEHLTLVMGEGARLFDGEGHRLKGRKAIGVGDYVREECRVQKEGPPIVTKITIIKRAWQMQESPEK